MHQCINFKLKTATESPSVDEKQTNYRNKILTLIKKTLPVGKLLLSEKNVA